MSKSALSALLPLMLLAVTAVAVMSVIAIRRNHRAAAFTALVGLIAALVGVGPAFRAAPLPLTPLLIIDHYALIYMALVLIASAVVTMLSFRYLSSRSEQKEEFYLLLTLAALGSMVLAASSHMISLFLGLELLSISLYALISYPRSEPLPVEAGIKYLVLAASSSAFLLFGLALLYISTGTMAFGDMAGRLSAPADRVTVLAGAVLSLAGIGFKLAVVPFHLWTPDVYQGAPLPATAFVATASKVGVFAFLLRWLPAGTPLRGSVLALLASVAVASMLAGNLLALRQTNVKRLLAYSSIAHMGYFLVAAIAGGALGRTAATYYLAAYVATILGAFGSLIALSGKLRDAETFEDVRGLAWRRPFLSSIFTAMLLSLAGIPLTGGFLGKFYVLTAGSSATLWTLVIVLIVSSTIGLVYYLRVIVALFSDAEKVPAPIEAAPGVVSGIVLVALTSAIFVLGIFPNPFWNVIATAATAMK